VRDPAFLDIINLKRVSDMQTPQYPPHVAATSDKLLSLFGAFVNLIDSEISNEKSRKADSFLLDELQALREQMISEAGNFALPLPESNAA
jgi:hypothetical protein